jgi:hypothetical protein
MTLEDIFQRFNRTPSATTADITLYVNAATGSDTNDGLTSGTAFKTIGAAIAKIPQIVNHVVTINLADGTYNEAIILNGIFGKGNIKIVGNSSNRNAVNVNNIYINNTIPYVHIEYLTFTKTNGEAINTTGALSVGVYNCSIKDGSGYAGIKGVTSNITVGGTDIVNRQVAILASTGSRIQSSNNTGTGNGTGLYAEYTGLIGKYGTQPGGTTAEAYAGGGEIR